MSFEESKDRSDMFVAENRRRPRFMFLAQRGTKTFEIIISLL